VAIIDPKRLDGSVEKVKLQPWDKGFKFERVVNEGDAVRHVFIGGQHALKDAKPVAALGKKRMGRFLESTH
jgi:hypothetical protein